MKRILVMLLVTALLACGAANAAEYTWEEVCAQYPEVTAQGSFVTIGEAGIELWLPDGAAETAVDEWYEEFGTVWMAAAGTQGISCISVDLTERDPKLEEVEPLYSNLMLGSRDFSMDTINGVPCVTFNVDFGGWGPEYAVFETGTGRMLEVSASVAPQGENKEEAAKLCRMILFSIRHL